MKLALTAVGQYFGGPIGGMIGGMVAGLISPENTTTYGPKLNDLKVLTSTYNNPIPLIFGRARVAGQVIFSTEKMPHEEAITEGGKGGPTATQVNTVYTLTFAVAICANQIDEIRKMYIAGACVFNMSDTADVETAIASQKIAKSIKIYKGTPDQLPNPLIQSFAGIDETSAYRNTAYVVFEDFNISNYGNQIPNIEFEVLSVSTKSHTKEPIIALTSSNPIRFNNYNVTNCIGYKMVRDGINKVNYTNIYRILENNQTQLISSTDALKGTYAFVADESFKTDDNSCLLRISTGGGPYEMTFYELKQDGSLIDLNTTNIGYISVSYINNIKYRKRNNKSYIFYNANISNYKHIIIDNLTNTSTAISTTHTSMVLDASFTDNFIYTCEGTVINKYDLNLNFIATIYTGTCLGVHAVSDTEIYTQTYISPNYAYSEISTGTAIFKIGSVAQDLTSLYYDSFNFYTTGNTSSYSKFINREKISAVDITPDEIVKTLCNKVGITNEIVNTTELNDSFAGFVVSRASDVKSALDPLQKAFFFDAVDSDGKLKFVKRGQTPCVFIPPDDLAVRNFGSDLGDNVNCIRQQDIDLPHEIILSYFDIDASYQINTQYARRTTTNAVNSISLDLPICTTADKAKVIVNKMLDEYWTNRTQVKITVGKKYSYLEPTDVYQTYKNGDLLTVRITDIEEQNGVLTITGLTDDETIYEQEAVGAKITPRNENFKSTSPTNLQILDIPLLRDIDDKNGVYLATSGYSTNWDGSVIYKSFDGGASYINAQSTTKNAVIGTTSTVLGNFLTGDIPDEINSVLIYSQQDLVGQSIINVINGSNLAIIGNEIIQFKNAVLTSEANVWKLSGFIRGKLGTEQYMSTHTIGERFVLLNINTISLLNLNSSEYDLTRIYKAVSYNDTITNSVAIPFTYNGVAQECYSPVHLGGGRDGSGNIILKWVRRSRINNTWNNKVDIPLGEDAELYEIDILNGSSVVRTLYSTTPTVNYSSADQITDFGSNQSSLNFNVYQVSTLRGRGNKATGNI